MKKENHTAILEFEVVNPTDELETVGEKLSLSPYGEYCPERSLRGYALLFLLDHPDHYRVSKIIMRGLIYIIPEGREKNYALKLKGLVANTYKFPSGMVATTGYDDEQIPELQGRYSLELHEQIKLRSNDKTIWHGY